ncbi:hypothetical protein EAM70_02785 [Salmonella enterica]|uniref:DUF551 domain-containing protein n=1 Tax=Salmonella enterica subsp. diarizonae serovar 48:i:z TaxID=1192842 RepID=A0A735RE84_SALDZ|nr:hypothetical protein [Salmonella enterica]HAE7123044.1 hypothetical protein [Salmonella enterica subsp. diarizonae serovar 48:i:z]
MNNKLTDEEITALALKLFDGSSFYFQSGRRPGAKTMAELLNKAVSAVAELQELRKADSAPPAQIVSIPDDWQTCEKLSDDSYVDNALRELVEDTTSDNGVRVVQAVMRALRDSGLIRTYPDLSQPVDPQISEYEKIMLRADWVMVPIEPTDEMIAAAMECDDVFFDSKDPTAFCVQYREIYCAMVDTAPALNKGEY